MENGISILRDLICRNIFPQAPNWLVQLKHRYTIEESGATVKNCSHLSVGVGNWQPVRHPGHTLNR